MTTLAALRAQIADDLARTDLGSQIDAAIVNAIDHYAGKRWFWNETRLATFATIVGQSDYTSVDDPDVPAFIELDAVTLHDGQNSWEVSSVAPEEMEYFLDGAASSGRPYWYSYYEDTFRLYPTPDIVYTVRPMGLIVRPPPATADETGNPWMTHARELIRCRAKSYIAAHTLMDAELASVMGAAEEQAYAALRIKTAKKQGAGNIVPTSF